MGLKNYTHKLKKYFWFSQEELLQYTITIIALALVYSWTQWGEEQFNAITGLKNLFTSCILIAITVFVHHAGQRMLALKLGFRAEQKIWWNGIIASLILAIVSNGKIIFLGVTTTLYYLLPIHRLGSFRYGPNMKTIAKMSLMGPLFNIFFAGIIKTMEFIGILNPIIAEKLFILNLAYAAWNLLPLPALDGAKIFYNSRVIYVLIASSIAAYVSLIYLLEVYSYIISALIGIIAMIIYYLIFERK